MTLRRQLLLLLFVHLALALAAWDGYRIGLRRGRAERLTPQTKITIEPNGAIRWCGDWRKDKTYQISDTVKDPDTDIFYVATKENRNVVPKNNPDVWAVFSRPSSALPPERTDANWRGN